MKVALKCFNRLYVRPNMLKDTFTWIYVFPNELNPTFFDNYLATQKHPKDIKNCRHIGTIQLNENEIEKWKDILKYTKTVGAFYNEYPTHNYNFIQRQYIVRDSYIRLH